MMNKLWVMIIVSIVSVMLAACNGQPENSTNPNELVMTGSTTVSPVGEKAIEGFKKRHPETKISISSTSSGAGIKALIDGTADIAMSSHVLNDTENQLARDKGIKVKENVIAWDAIVPIVHPSNPVTNLTLAQLKDIYTGKITNWEAVGGKKGNIVVVSRESSSGTYESWNEMVLNKEGVVSSAQLDASSGETVEVIGKTPHAIGYVGIGYVEGNSTIKPLSVDGVRASPSTVTYKTYKIARPLYMITRSDPKMAALRLINFVLSPDGQKLVMDAKFVPVPGK